MPLPKYIFAVEMAREKEDPPAAGAVEKKIARQKRRTMISSCRKGQRMLASEDFFPFPDLLENSIQLPGLCLGDVSPGQLENLDLHRPAGEIDSQPLPFPNLSSGFGLMPVDGYDAPVTSLLGQGAAFDQAALGQKEIQSQSSALESDIHVDLVSELFQPGLQDLGDLMLPGQFLQSFPVIVQSDLPLVGPVDHLQEMIAR